jgi:hypothetical protein
MSGLKFPPHKPLFLMPDVLGAMKLGCHSKKLAAPITPHIGAGAPPPGSYPRLTAVQRVMGQNNTYPDCVPTAYLNAIKTWAGRTTGNYSYVSDDTPLEIYKIFDPSLTTGMNPEDLYAWGTSNAVLGWKLKSWHRVNPQDMTAVRETVEAYGGISVIVELSVEQQNQKVWQPVGTPGSWGGHNEFTDSWSGAYFEGTSWGEPMYASEEYMLAPTFTVGAYALEFEAA